MDSDLLALPAALRAFSSLPPAQQRLFCKKNGHHLLILTDQQMVATVVEAVAHLTDFQRLSWCIFCRAEGYVPFNGRIRRGTHKDDCPAVKFLNYFHGEEKPVLDKKGD